MAVEPMPRRSLLKVGCAGVCLVFTKSCSPTWWGGRTTSTTVTPTTAGSSPTTTLAVEPTGRRGPTGQRLPAGTPPYATPATRRASGLADLHEALAEAGSGEVVEVDSDLISASQIVFQPGPTRTRNVLVRPPVGQRRRISEVRIRQDRLTLAGFDLLGHGFIGDSGYPLQGSYSGYWRCTQARSSFLVLTVHGAFLVECVGYEDDFDDDSRVTIYGYRQWAVDRLLIDGCWWGVANYLVPGSDAHVDGIQVEGAAGGGVHNITVRDSVIAQGASVTALLKPNGGYLRWINNWSSKDRVASFHALSMENYGAEVVVTDSDINGHVVWAGRPPETFARNRLRKINIAVDATNTVDESGNWPMDPLGDLTALWRECPWRRP